MSEGASGALAVMAGALVVIALVQVAVLIVIARVARQAADTAQQMQRELKPLIEKAHRITDDAAKVAALTLRQVERLDELVATTSERINAALNVVQTGIIEPLQRGTALVAGFKAAVSLMRQWLQRPRREPPDDEDTWFVG